MRKEALTDLLMDWIKGNPFRSIDKDHIASIFQTDERQVRRAISKLRREKIVYYPDRKLAGIYHKAMGTKADRQNVANELEKILKGMASEYFDTAIAYKNYLKDDAKELAFPLLVEKAEQLEIIFEGLKGE